MSCTAIWLKVDGSRSMSRKKKKKKKVPCLRPGHLAMEDSTGTVSVCVHHLGKKKAGYVWDDGVTGYVVQIGRTLD